MGFSQEGGGSGSASSGGAASSLTIGEAAATAAGLAMPGVQEADAVYLRCWVEHDDGRAECYEVEFLAGSTEYQYEIDLYTGAILKSERETYGSSGGTSAGGSASGSSGLIGEAAARSAALAHAGVSDASRVEVELDRDDGRTLYEVEFHAGPDGIQLRDRRLHRRHPQVGAGDRRLSPTGIKRAAGQKASRFCRLFQMVRGKFPQAPPALRQAPPGRAASPLPPGPPPAPAGGSPAPPSFCWARSSGRRSFSAPCSSRRRIR